MSEQNEHRQHCTIDIPPGVASGRWKLHVIANGIASEHVWVDNG